MLDVTPLAKALSQLEISLRFLHSESAQQDVELHGQFRAAAIQHFEVTFELAVRMIRRALAELAVTGRDAATADFLDVMRMAADAGLIRDPRPFRAWRDKRNKTSHTYNEITAGEIATDLDAFVADIRFLLAEIERRIRA